MIEISYDTINELKLLLRMFDLFNASSYLDDKEHAKRLYGIPDLTVVLSDKTSSDYVFGERHDTDWYVVRPIGSSVPDGTWIYMTRSTLANVWKQKAGGCEIYNVTQQKVVDEE